MISQHTRRPTAVITACAILTISTISFLRLNLYEYLDVRAFDANENEDGIVMGGTQRLHHYMNHTNATLGREKNSINPNYTVHNHNYTQNSLLFDNSSVSEDDELLEQTEVAESMQATRREVFAKLSQLTEFATKQPSPACKPNLDLALPNWGWDNTTKFEKIYFYHVRKAYVNETHLHFQEYSTHNSYFVLLCILSFRGGTSLAQYFKKVATHYGLGFQHVEWKAAEEPAAEPSTKATFYVTHLREPVDRAISHFKCKIFKSSLQFQLAKLI